MKADKELDKILEKYPFGGEWEDWKNLKADIQSLIDTRVREAYEKGYMDGAIGEIKADRLAELTKEGKQ